MIRHDRTERYLVCDECEADEFGPFERDDFQLMIDEARSDGWEVEKTPAGEFKHRCPDCRPSRLDRALDMFGDLD